MKKLFSVTLLTPFRSLIAPELGVGQAIRIKGLTVPYGRFSVTTASIASFPVLQIMVKPKISDTPAFNLDRMEAIMSTIPTRQTAIGASTPYAISSTNVSAIIKGGLLLPESGAVDCDTSAFDATTTGSLIIAVEYEVVSITQDERASLQVRYG